MRLNVRRGAIPGLVLSIVLSAGAAARSTDQLQAFAVTFAVTVTASLIVLALVFGHRSSRCRQSER